MATIAEMMADKLTRQAQQAGVSEEDIELAREAGMHPIDWATIREFSADSPGYAFVVRCPKPESYALQGVFPPKRGHIVKKTGDSGAVVVNKLRRAPGGAPLFRDGKPIVDTSIHVSDYDLMGIWVRELGAWRRIRVAAADGAKRGAYGQEAALLLRRLNKLLIAPIQHGCQDDWDNPCNPGVKTGETSGQLPDRFAVFWDGSADIKDDPRSCALFYAEELHAPWPYRADGTFRGAGGG